MLIILLLRRRVDQIDCGAAVLYTLRSVSYIWLWQLHSFHEFCIHGRVHILDYVGFS